MSRPAPGLGSVGETLSRVLADDIPDGITRGPLRGALATLRADVLRLIDEDGPTATADALGVSRATLARWRAEGGWLAGVEP